ncbi:DUF4158 domain-containing protein [Nonomuraea sp. NPDC004186]|uniref:DUF4158 domain-containing protein n=1 Tax=Nonomuraea sp. NPDC049625 TaxID=3155775 RepID=UPI0034267A70
MRSYPDIGRDDLIRYFTLTPADVAFIDPGRGRGPTDRLGFAVQLATLPWLGFVPDEVVMLFDQAVSARESRAKTKTDEALIERAKAGEARQLLLEVILPVLADPSIPDEQIGGLLRNTIGMSKLREVVTEGWKKLPRDHGRLSALHASHTYLRQFTPQVLAAIDFKGGTAT